VARLAVNLNRPNRPVRTRMPGGVGGRSGRTATSYPDPASWPAGFRPPPSVGQFHARSSVTPALLVPLKLGGNTSDATRVHDATAVVGIWPRASASFDSNPRPPPGASRCSARTTNLSAQARQGEPTGLDCVEVPRTEIAIGGAVAEYVIGGALVATRRERRPRGARPAL
jgi:hypothetical protein